MAFGGLGGGFGRLGRGGGNGPHAINYTLNVGTEFQTIDGIGAELQSDSIEGDGTGIQESNTKGLPFGLTAGEQTRFADEVLAYEGHPITYLRFAKGLYYRGLSADGKSYTRERIPGQNASIKAALDRAGCKLAVGNWSPPTFWKLNGAFNGATEPIPDRDTQPTQWNAYMRAGLQGGTLNCPDKVGDPTGYAAWQTDFGAAELATLEYIHQNVGCVGIIFYQNEPSISTSYPSCVWLGVQAYDHLKIMMALIAGSSILATYGGQPNTILWQGDEQNGQTGLGMGTARADVALMGTCYGWSRHNISQMANDRNWAHNNLGALTGNLSGFAARAFCSEYEFFDEFVTVGDPQYMTDGERFSNIISNAFRFFSEAASRIHYWIHVGKNSDGPVAERNGRALTTWRPTGAAAPSDYPSLAQGAFTPIKVNYNSNMAMVRHILAGSTRVGVTIPAYDNNIATLGLRRSDQRHVFGIVNSGAATRRVALDTGGLTFTGYRYDATNFGVSRGQKVNIDTVLPGYTAEFWVQDAGVPFAMAAPTVLPGNTTADVTRAAAPNNNGSAITGYDLRYSTDQSNWTTVTMSTNPQTITSLANDVLVYVQTRANNAIGNGVWSPSGTTTPVAVPADFTTDFSGHATGDDISLITGITRTDGAAGGMTISSAVSCNSNTTATSGVGYSLPTTSSLVQKIFATVKGVSGSAGPCLCVRYTDEANWVGVRWSSSQYDLVKKVAGTATILLSTSGVTPTIGDVVRLEIDASHNARVLINGTQRIVPTAIAAAGLTSLKPGLVPRIAAKTPFIDDLTSGPN